MSTESRPHDVSNPRLCQCSILDAVQYAATRTQLHDQVDVLIVLKDALHTGVQSLQKGYSPSTCLEEASETLPLLQRLSQGFSRRNISCCRGVRQHTVCCHTQGTAPGL